MQSSHDTGWTCSDDTDGFHNEDCSTRINILLIFRLYFFNNLTVLIGLKKEEKQEVQMAIRNMTSPKRESGKMDILRKDESDVMRFRNEMDRIFDNFFSDPFGLLPISRLESAFTPRVDVVETEKEVTVTAEIPGMDEKDIQVTLMDGRLTIGGEKSSEHEEETGQYHRMERSYGSFRRDVVLPAEVERDKVDAVFSKGVLTITLPKLAESVKRTRKIPVQKG
jgi:HSP20 family protein